VPLRARPSIPGVPDDAFVFLSILEWSDRKNPDGLVDAFIAAFRGRRDVVLVLKLSFRFGADRRAVLAGLAERLRPKVMGFGPFRPPRVVVIIGELGDDAIDALHARADAYVSLHRAEGFGLTLAHAMARGTPVVATAYSANLEFMDDECAFLVEADVVPATSRIVRYGFDESMTWANPRRDAAVAALRACAGSPSLRARVADAGRRRVARDLSFARVGALMVRALADAGAPVANFRSAEAPREARPMHPVVE
jgi:glycosyltransferase involved in cell wall biosynthesis